MAQRGSSRRNEPETDARLVDRLTEKLSILLRKSRAWKPQDVTAIDEILDTLSNVLARACQREEEDTGRDDLTRQIMLSIGKLLFPHLAREITTLDRHNRTPSGVLAEQLVKIMDLISRMQGLPGFEKARGKINQSSPRLRVVMEVMLAPVMNFTNAVLVSDNGSKAFARIVELRGELAYGLRRIVCTEGSALPYFTLYPRSCVVVMRFLDALEYDTVGLQSVALAACDLIEAACDDCPSIELLPVAVNETVTALLRAFLRMELRPSNDVTRRLCVRVLGALQAFCLFLQRTQDESTFGPPVNLMQLAAFPMLLDWTTDPWMLETVGDACIDVLDTFCYGLVLKAAGRMNLVNMTSEEATRLLRFCLNRVTTDVHGMVHEVVTRETARIFRSIFSVHVPHDSEFVEALVCPEMELVMQIVKHDFQTGWPFMPLMLNPDLLSKFLAGGVANAQLLLDGAITCKSHPLYDRECIGLDLHLEIIHFGLEATAGIEGVSYDKLREFAADIARICETQITRQSSTQLGISVLNFLLLHDVNEEDAVVESAELLASVVAVSDTLADAPQPPKKRVVEWNAAGWKLRASVIDNVLAIFFKKKMTERCWNAVFPWTHKIACCAPHTQDEKLVELKARAAYCALLFISDARAETLKLPSVERACLEIELAVTVANTARNLGPLLSPIAEEFTCLTLWTYCALCLADTPSEFELAHETLRYYCQGILNERRRAGDEHTREAAGEAVRLIAEHCEEMRREYEQRMIDDIYESIRL